MAAASGSSALLDQGPSREKQRQHILTVLYQKLKTAESLTDARCESYALGMYAECTSPDETDLLLRDEKFALKIFNRVSLKMAIGHSMGELEKAVVSKFGTFSLNYRDGLIHDPVSCDRAVKSALREILKPQSSLKPTSREWKPAWAQVVHPAPPAVTTTRGSSGRVASSIQATPLDGLTADEEEFMLHSLGLSQDVASSVLPDNDFDAEAESFFNSSKNSNDPWKARSETAKTKWGAAQSGATNSVFRTGGRYIKKGQRIKSKKDERNLGMVETNTRV